MPLVMLAAIYLAAALAGYLAMPALAALLILIAWNMTEPHTLARATGDAQVATWCCCMLTAVLTVLVDLTVAIGVGVALGLALRLRRREVPPPDWSRRNADATKEGRARRRGPCRNSGPERISSGRRIRRPGSAPSSPDRARRRGAGMRTKVAVILEWSTSM